MLSLCLLSTSHMVCVFLHRRAYVLVQLDGKLGPPSYSPYESRMLIIISKCELEIRLECSRFEIDLSVKLHCRSNAVWYGGAAR